MIVDSKRIRILCYGDSNTWARDPVLLKRHDIDVRWPGTLQRLLGDKYDVIEEGLGGRTVNQDDATKLGKNGKTYLTPCLESHVPIDIVIIMLGTNDLKNQFSSTPESITEGLSGLIDDTYAVFDKNEDKRPRIIMLSPVHIDSDNPEFMKIYGHAYDKDCGEKSKMLSDPIRTMCETRVIEFFDAQDYAHAGDDGLHLSADSHQSLAMKLAEVITT
jgi:lysophospholipase L1-like esterase